MITCRIRGNRLSGKVDGSLEAGLFKNCLLRNQLNSFLKRSQAIDGLLLTSLPNLTTLYAHLPETDIFLAEVLKRALEVQKTSLRTNLHHYKTSTKYILRAFGTTKKIGTLAIVIRLSLDICGPYSNYQLFGSYQFSISIHLERQFALVTLPRL